MGKFATEHLSKFNNEQLDEWERILKNENIDLLKWVIEGNKLPIELNTPLMRDLIKYTHTASESVKTTGGNQ